MFKRMVRLSAVAAVVFGLCACGGNNKGSEVKSKDLQVMDQLEIASTYDASKSSVVPENAFVALKIMPEQLFNKAIGGANSRLARQWNQLKLSLAMMEPAFGDASKLGLCLDKPFFVTMSGDFKNIARNEASIEMCLIAPLSDRDAFIKALDNLIEMSGEELGASKDYSVDSYAHYLLSQDIHKALDLGVMSKVAVMRLSFDSDGDFKDLKGSMPKLFASSGKGKPEGFKEFYTSTTDLSAWFDMEEALNTILPVFKAYPAEAAMLLELFEEYMPLYKGASLVTDLDFKNGQTVLEFKLFGSEKLREYGMKYNAVASDKYFENLPSTSVFVANLAIKDLPGLVEEMSKTNPQMGEMMEYLEDSLDIDEEFLAGFNGLITFALDGYMIDQREVPGIVLYVECDENVWRLVEENLNDTAEMVSPYQYNVGDRMYIGYDGTAIIAVEAETLRRSYNSNVSNFANTPLAAEISEGGFALNLEALPTRLLNDFAEETGILTSGRELLKYVSSLTISSSADHMTATIKLNMGDQSNNLLNKLLLLMTEQINF